MSGLKTPKTSNGKMCLGSLEIKDVQEGDLFLCISDVRMIDDNELVYKKGEFYRSDQSLCITDRAGRIDHYWEKTDWTHYFIKWRGHKRKHMSKQRHSLEESWFSESLEENHVKPETWKTALGFEKVWLKNWCVDPEWWNVTPYGSIVLDLETDDGIVSIEFGGHRIGFYTEFEEGMEDYASEGFDWTEDGDLLSETLKMLLCKYANH
jgi:hypothetical protein